MGFIIIDPLKMKINELLSKGEFHPFSEAILRYGSPEDIGLLIDKCKSTTPGSDQYYFIDFTPFVRGIELLPRFIDSINDANTNKRPVIMLSSIKNIRDLKEEYSQKDIPIPVIHISEKSGDVMEIFGGNEMDKSLYEKIKKPFFVNDNLDTYNISELRRTFSDKILVDLLFAANCLDIPSNKDPEETKRYVSGVYYRKMPNGMLVTCYLNLKNFGTNIKFLVDVAYELVAHTMNYFCSDHNTLDDFDYFIVPNNTALFLSTLIQTIIGKPVISIDRLGPIPTLLPYDEPLINSLAQKKVIVIEEVIATGSEVDRTIQYLHHLKVHVNEVIAIYNLEVGKPALISEKNIFSLCKPKKELRYEYRSQFSEETTVKELEQ